jgi:preprotein translocase SecE subunit
MKDLKEKIVNYLKETMLEMKKVTWPDRRYVTVASLVVLGLVFVTGVFVMLVDFVLTKLFGLLLK